MKKILLFICLLPIISAAQIAPIQTHEKPYEFICNVVFHYFPDDTYYLHAQSDNQFEDDVVRIKLGNSLNEVAVSLSNLLPTFNNAGQLFDIGGYSFIVVDKYMLKIKNVGTLEYTAGNYYVRRSNIIRAIVEMVNRGADVGTVKLVMVSGIAGKMKAYLNNYGVNVNVECGTSVKPFLSHRYEEGEEIDALDVCALHNAVMSGDLPHNDILARMLCD